MSEPTDPTSFILPDLADSSSEVVAQVPITTNLKTSVPMYLGRNVTITNTSDGGVDLGSLQLKTKSIVNSTGLNIMSQDDPSVCNLTIGSGGVVLTNMEYTGFNINYQTEDEEYKSTTLYSGSDPNFSKSTTQNALTTQEYVDKQIWQQTKRINTILGTDEEAVKSFNRVLGIVTELAGNADTIATLNDYNEKYVGLLDDTREVQTSMSTILAQATNTVSVNVVGAVYADGCPPLPIPYTYNQLGYKQDGWWFGRLNLTEKINWYIPTEDGMTFATIQQMNIQYYARSIKQLPWITVYTKIKGDGNDKSWYRSKYTFHNPHSEGYNNVSITCNVVPGNDLAVVTFASPDPNKHKVGNWLFLNNKEYQIVSPLTDGSCYLHRIGDMDLVVGSTYTGTLGGKHYCDYTTNKVATSIMNIENCEKRALNLDISSISSAASDDDEILLIALSTNSAGSVDDTDFVLKSFSIREETGTTQYVFSNANVVSNYTFNTLFQKNADFSPLTTKSTTHLNTYNETYGTHPIS